MLAKDIMTTNVITVKANTPISEVARIMATNNVSGLPVIDDDNNVIGIVTEDDLLLKHDQCKQPPRLALFGFWVVPEEPLLDAYKSCKSMTAADVMSSEVIVFEEDDTVGKIAQVMVEKNINRVPIVKDNKLVGIVTRADIIKSIAGIKEKH